MRTTAFLVSASIAALLLAACGKAPDPAPAQTEVKIQPADANRGLNPSGRPEAPLIDPSKKSVVVLVPPSAPQMAERQEARLVAEQEKVEGRIHDLMDTYTDNLGNPRQKDKVGEQISQELEAYKRQSLEIYKLQRQKAMTANRESAAQ